MIVNVKQIIALLSVTLGSPSGDMVFVRKNHGGQFPDAPFGAYSVLPVRSDLSGMYPHKTPVENPDPTKSEYQFRKLEECTVSLSFYGGTEIKKVVGVLTDPFADAYDMAERAMDYIVLSGLETIRQAGFVVRPVTGIEDRTFNFEGMQSQYVCGFDISVKAYRYATLVVDRIDLDTTEAGFDLTFN